MEKSIEGYALDHIKTSSNTWKVRENPLLCFCVTVSVSIVTAYAAKGTINYIKIFEFYCQRLLKTTFYFAISD